MFYCGWRAFERMFPMCSWEVAVPVSAYYSVSSITDPLAVACSQGRIAEYASWRACLPADSHEDRDWTEHAAALTRSLGSSARFIAANLEALTTLDRLPQPRSLVESLHHLDMLHLRKIDTTLLALPQTLEEDPEFWSALDENLTDYLSPSHPNQLLPTPSAISRRITGLIRILDTPADAPPQPGPETYRRQPRGDGTSTVETTHDEVTATIIDQAVHTYARTHGCSTSRALADLLLDKISVTVVLNLYRAADVEDAPGYLLPLGWLDLHSTDTLAAMATRSRNMDDAARAQVGGYQVNAAIRTYLEGRDAVCRWSGCHRSALRSHKDHRINHADGGPTTASNMVTLCQHHHNRKTNEQMTYLLDDLTGDVYWLFRDGTWACDRAEGPLAPRQRHWVQGLSQRRRKRQRHARRKGAIQPTSTLAA